MLGSVPNAARSMLRMSAIAGLGICLSFTVCGKKTSDPQKKKITVLQVKGSDTKVNIAQAWAEAYKKVAPGVEVEVSGGGSGVGLAALEKGAIDIANASRRIKPEEILLARENTGKEPKEVIVGYDAMAIYVNKDNPLDRIAVEQLAGIFAEGGSLTTWSQLGIRIPGSAKDEIIRVSRQSSSGTYDYFREQVLSNKDFKLGSRDMNGSKDVVELISNTKTAIGYSGMGFATPGVKMLNVAFKPGDTAYAPTVDNALTRKYPLTRPLRMYTLGEPEGEIKRYIDWVLSDEGQKILKECGYVPIPR